MAKQMQSLLTGSSVLTEGFHDDIPLTFSSYADVANRPRFRPEVDTKTSQIVDLVSTYHFPEKHPCGKKGCHQPHNNGWVAITTDNHETLIGSKCGLEWGGKTFALARNQLAKRQRRQSNLDLLRKTVQNADPTFAKILEINKRGRGASWLMKALDKFNTECSSDLLRIVKDRARRGETSIIKSQRKTEEERELDPTSSSAYKTKIVGHLVGLEVFNKDIRAILMDNVWSKLKNLQKMDIENLPTPTLSKLAKEVVAFDQYISEAEGIISNGVTFFSTPSNFEFIKAMDEKHKHTHLTRIDWFSI